MEQLTLITKKEQKELKKLSNYLEMLEIEERIKREIVEELKKETEKQISKIREEIKALQQRIEDFEKENQLSSNKDLSEVMNEYLFGKTEEK